MEETRRKRNLIKKDHNKEIRNIISERINRDEERRQRKRKK
jgi:hypothetical protein